MITGQTAECAPSHIKGLWDDFHEPFALALAGYVVVAPDYAGLGVSTVPSPYFVLPTQANDLAHAIQAAQGAFPRLSREFVIMGQSQGGGVAWSFAQRQATRPISGYLGTVAVSPFTDILADIVADPQAEDNARVIGIAQGLNSVLDSFQFSDWVTETGINRHSLLEEVGGCGTAAGAIAAANVPLLKGGWNLTSAAQWYRNVSDNGNKPFAGPMLVLQGDIDGNANVNVTEKSVDETCAMFPDNSLRYIQYTNISHVPALYASQHVWMDWILDRFRGVKEPKGCVKEEQSPVTGIANGAGQNWIIEYDKYGL
jgi:pimeloyl-ACP methyl ester carboxylesterase